MHYRISNQFSLRMAFAVLGVLCVLAVWFRHEIGRAQKERDVVDVVQAFGGVVDFEWQVSSDGLTVDQNGNPLEWTRSPPAPLFLRETFGENLFSRVVGASFFLVDDSVDANGVFYLKRFPHLRHLYIGCGEFDTTHYLKGLSSLQTLTLERVDLEDSDLECMSAMRSLVQLNLKGNRISDRGLTHLRHLSNLEVLVLDANRELTGAEFHLLSDLSNLRELHLKHTRVNDKALSSLRNMKTLRVLSLFGTNITDQGLKQLVEYPSLVELDLQLTSVTRTGVAHLQAKKPSMLLFSEFSFN